jgi:four helix bundle protein
LEEPVNIMSKIETFRELQTYQRARGEARRIFMLSKRFPVEERYSLIDQIRRSSRAVAAMIGEAWARRRYEPVFINKLSEALGESTETQVWLDHAFDAGYITEAERKEHDAAWSEVSAMLHGMIEKADAFCRSASAQR